MIDLNDVIPVSAAPVRYDLDVIVARLRDTAESWVPQYFPNGRRVGNDWRLANIRGDPPRKNGSCVIALKGPHAGDWYEHDGGQGGGPLNALEQATGLTHRDLYGEAADIVGWSAAPPAREGPQQAPKPDRDPAREIDFILSKTQPLTDTPAARYLRGRGLRVPETAELLFHSDLTHWDTKTGYPAMIGIVRNHAGKTIAIHRTYLAVDDQEPTRVVKASVPKPRMMLGKVAGGAVRLGTIGGNGTLGLCEGIETGLAVMTVCPEIGVWATLATSNLEQVQLPAEALRITIFADNDASGAGARAAETAARRFRAEGRQVTIALPPQAGDDFNDLLLRDGPDAVAATVRDALRKHHEDTAQPPRIGCHSPIGFTQPKPPLPSFRADEGDLARSVDRGWGLLMAANRTPWLFRAGGLPTWIVPDDEGRPFAATITDERLRYMLARLANWQRIAQDGQLMPAPPPTGLIKALLATPDPGLPVLAGIVNTPVFGRGGMLLTEPGYHPDARLLYHAAPGFQLPSIPDHPTAQQIDDARELLLVDLLGDFPFTSLAERAHAIALLLLGFVRAMIDGPTPLHLIEKPSPGTGATLMVDAIATIITGAGTLVMSESRDDEEWRKRITAKLRQIPSIVLIDNLRSKLDSSALAAALTAPHWEDRLLGASETLRFPIRCLWIATGNNPEFSNEMARRLVRIRLDARVDQPWRREGFRHPDLMGWVRANRARLVAACLTLCRAWIAAGRPAGDRCIGSYEAWAQTLGGILDVAGIEGFLENLDDMMAASDSDGAMWRAFAAAWWDRFGTADVGTGDLYEVATGCEPPLPLGSGNDRSQRTRLGKLLGRMRDRVFEIPAGAVRITLDGTYQGAKRWRLNLENADGPNLVNVGGGETNVHDNVHEVNQLKYNDNSASRERRERRERFPDPYTRGGARAHTEEDPEKRSRRSRRSPNPGNPRVSDGERCGEHEPNVHERSPMSDLPEWLKEVMT